MNRAHIIEICDLLIIVKPETSRRIWIGQRLDHLVGQHGGQATITVPGVSFRIYRRVKHDTIGNVLPIVIYEVFVKAGGIVETCLQKYGQRIAADDDHIERINQVVSKRMVKKQQME